MSQQIRQKALDLLARREHSRFELQQKLTRYGFVAADIATVLDELVQQKLLNDARFTEEYVRMRVRRGFGPLRIREELHERGISTEIITESLFNSNFDWQELAKETFLKKFAGKSASSLSDKAAMMRYLQYKGYDFAVIKQVFK